MFKSKANNYSDLHSIVENPHGGVVLSFAATEHFEASRGELYTTAQPVRGFNFGASAP